MEENHLDRLAAAHQTYTELKREADRWIDRLRQQRDERLLAARDGGCTQQQMADVMGISRARVQQLLDRLDREPR